MTHALVWLPQVLEAAGLKVATVNGWDQRGVGDMGPVLGAMCHHTAGSRSGNMPSLTTLVSGRHDLPGPLAQLGLGRDGTYYVIAAGRCNHAGTGQWQGISSGNSNFIGIEVENAGTTDDLAWPAVQLNACRRGVAAILSHVGRGVEYCVGHKEYALPKGRKIDPLLDMDEFRSSVAALLNGGAHPPVLIPSKEPLPAGDGKEARPTLRRGASGELVRYVQAKCGVTQDGQFGPLTEAAVRQFQRRYALVPDGIVGPLTWRALDAA